MVTMRILALVFISICLISACAPNLDSTSYDDSKNKASQSFFNDKGIKFAIPGSYLQKQSSEPGVIVEFIIDPVSQTKLKVYSFDGLHKYKQAYIAKTKAEFNHYLIINDESYSNSKGTEIKLFEISGNYQHDSKVVENFAKFIAITDTVRGTFIFEVSAPTNIIIKSRSDLKKLLASIDVYKHLHERL
jgi:hypothetical protein